MTECTRRRAITAVGAIATVTTAGCLGGGGDEKRKEAAAAIENEVASEVIDIQIEAGSGVTLIKYVTAATSANGMADEIRAIVDRYLTQIDEGVDLAHIDADVQNGEGVTLGEWEVTPRWLDRYKDGSLTATGVSQKAVQSFST